MVGWLIEVCGGWNDRPFLTNLYSAFIGGLIALPLAVIVISQLAARQAESIAVARSERQLESASAGLKDAASKVDAAVMGVGVLHQFMTDLGGFGSAPAPNSVSSYGRQTVEGLTSKCRAQESWWNATQPKLEAALVELGGAWSTYRLAVLRCIVPPAPPHPSYECVGKIDESIREFQFHKDPVHHFKSAAETGDRILAYGGEANSDDGAQMSKHVKIAYGYIESLNRYLSLLSRCTPVSLRRVSRL